MKKIKDYQNYSYKARVLSFVIDLLFYPFFRLFHYNEKSFPDKFADKKNIKKILIIRLDHIGDYLMLTPAVRSLKTHYPDAQICLLCSPSNKSLAENNKYIDKLYTLSLKWYDGTRNFSLPLKNYFNLISKIRNENFDICIDFRSDIRSLFFLTLFSKAKIKIGFSHLGGEEILTHKIKYIPDMHWIKLNLKLLEIFNIKTNDFDYDIFINKKDEENAEHTIKKNNILKLNKRIILHLGGIKHWGLKKLPLSQWKKIIDIIKKYTDEPIILTGDKNDMVIVSEFLKISDFKFINLCDKLSLNEFCYLIKISDLILCNDTSAMHIAAGYKKYNIAFFGPTASKKSGAIYNPNILIIEKNVNCKKPCYKKDCEKNHQCFELDKNDFIKIENFIKNILQMKK